MGSDIDFDCEHDKIIKQIVLIFVFDKIERDIIAQGKVCVQTVLILGKFLKIIGHDELGDRLINTIIISNDTNLLEKIIIHNVFAKRKKQYGDKFIEYYNKITKPCFSHIRGTDNHLNGVFQERWKPYRELVSEFVNVATNNDNTGTAGAFIKIWENFEKKDQFFTHFNSLRNSKRRTSKINTRGDNRFNDNLDLENPLNISWIFSSNTSPNDVIKEYVLSEVKNIIQKCKKNYSDMKYHKPIISLKLSC